MRTWGLVVLLFLGLLVIKPLQALEREDMQASDLMADGHAMLENQRILLLVLTRSDCPYCHALMRNVMLPLVMSGVWEHRVLVRELELDRSPVILDFSGKPAAAISFAERYGHPFTPSILFLDRCGREVGARHSGYDGGDFYEFYLEKSVASAAQWLAANPPTCSS